MQRFTRRNLPVLLASLSFAGCTDQSLPTDPWTPAASPSRVSAPGDGRFLVAFSHGRAPFDFAARVSERGGTVEEVLVGPGIAIVSGLTPVSAAELAGTAGIDAVAENRVVFGGSTDEEASSADLVTPAVRADEPGSAGVNGRKPLPSDAIAYDRQWNMRIIHAESAWRAMEFGSPTVRVYLLDTGVDYTRTDLRSHVDPARSIALVPGDSAGEYAVAKDSGVAPYMDFHSHGTAVAATIVSNGIDLAGVTTKTKIVAVKVLDRSRSGSLETFVKGINYAADNGADVIHLSPAHPGFSTEVNPANAAAMIAMVDRATTYAHRRGAVVVVPGGNNFGDLDKSKWWRACNAKFVVCVSATTAKDESASYTNYGVNTVSVAGPGGDNAKPTDRRVLATCSSYALMKTGNVAPCGAGHPTFETIGTTYGAAAVSGLAALIISRIGPGQPDRVRDILERSADDLGPRGRDAYYGHGRINVARALQLIEDERLARNPVSRTARVVGSSTTVTP